MSRFPNLPGFIINAVDGGLAARRAPLAKSTLIFGTAAQGVADSPYQATDRLRPRADAPSRTVNLARGREAGARLR